MERPTNSSPNAIAIIGMAGRFPGAGNVGQLWANLAAGVESIRLFSEQELRAGGVEPRLLSDPAYVRMRSVVDGAEMFDAAFFGLSPREAEVIDPQHRLLLECAWEALELAGYDPGRYPGPIGVFAGAGINTYLLSNILHNPEVMEAVGQFQAMVASAGDFLATRISYKLGLRGPSLTVQTACSTSLVAVHLAIQSLLNNECDMALAGGVRLLVPRVGGHVYQPGGLFSRDGHCRAFDAAATGTREGEGFGLVVLKRLSDALADGDHIHAVILGSAINNDGSGKMGYTVPGIEGQTEVIAMAQALAGVEPATIGLVEAQGMGTPLGDPIEATALWRVFSSAAGTGRPCALGSLKSNIGHLDAAAGVASLIKAALAVEHGLIPPSLHFEQPNPQIDFASGLFYVPTEATPWPAGGPRRAGVSSFGIGGTNAHVVLEEAPEVPPGTESGPLQLLVLSAATGPALETATKNLAEHLRRHPGLDLADVAYTLQVGRATFDHRRIVVCESIADAVEALTTLDPERVLTRVREADDPALVRDPPKVPASPADGDGTDAATLTTLGQLWLAGADVDWVAFHSRERRLRVPLPTYPFERQRYWVEPASGRRSQDGGTEAADRTRDSGTASPRHARPDLGTPYVEPRGELEERLAAIWGQVLGLDRVGAADDFFALGGHSLLGAQMMTRVREMLGVDIPIGRLFEAATVAGFASLVEAQLARRGAAWLDEIPRLPRDGELPLSFAQERLWFLDQLQPGTPLYNSTIRVEMAGRLDLAVLAAAILEVVRRHEALRTNFSAVAGRPRQVISPDNRVALPVIDLRSLPAAMNRAEAERLTRAEARLPFDLGRDSLLRTLMLRQEDERHVLLLTIHHIVSDGWSMGVLVQELGTLFGAFRAGRPSPLPELAVQYADFAAWQRRHLSGAFLEAELAWWREQLAGMPAGIELPADHPRPAASSGRGDVHEFVFEPASLAGLTAFSRGQGATLFMTLLAAFAGVVQRYTGVDDLVVGAPVADRTRVEIEPLIGFFSNTLVLRIDLSGEPDFAELLRRVRETALSSFAHQEMPFERLAEELAPERALSRSPLVQILFVIENASLGTLEQPGLTLTASVVPSGTAKFDLSCMFVETARGLEGAFEYSLDLFEPPTVARLVEHFTRLLGAGVAAPWERVSELPLLSPEERAQVLVEWSGKAAGTRVYILDRNLAPTPIGVPGELCIGGGGDGLPGGYPAPEQPAERFLPDPFGSEAGGRLFRTGDRARWRPNGEIQPLGRIGEPIPAGVFETGETVPAGAASRTPVEELLAGVWAEVLEVEAVGLRDNFFSLGGHSLLVTQVISRVRETFRVELPVRSLFEAPTPAGFGFRIRQALQSAERALLPPIQRIPRDGDLPLSFAQARLWFLDQLAPSSSAYNLPAGLRIRGPLDLAVMAAALSETVRRHEALRTMFDRIDGKPVQVIAAPAPVPLPQVDLRGLPEARRSAQAFQWLQEEGHRPFDLARGPLMRSLLVRLEDEEHLLILNMHHIVSDGWSMGVLVREICALYPALQHGQPSPLPELPIQYVDFASWQRQWLQGKVLETELGYWREQLKDMPAALELPTDRPRPAMQTFAGQTLAFALPRELSTRLQALSRRVGSTLFMTLLAVFQELLGRYSGQSDLAVGSPVAGRTHLQTEDLIGFFVNMLVLRADLAGGPSFSTLVGQVRETLLSAYAHQDLPFETLVEELQPSRSLSRTPYYQVVLALQNTPNQALEVENLSFEAVPVEIGMAKFDLTVSVQETEAGLAGIVEYNKDLFDAPTLLRLVRHWEMLLAGVISAPERPLEQSSLLSPEERLQLLVEWSGQAAGRRVYVLDRNLEPVPIGVPGELYLGGDAPEHEPPAERFVPDPFGTEPGGRLFRTGDRARWRSSGEIEILVESEQPREGEASETAPAQEISRTPVEELIAGIWAEVLGAEAVGVRDNFFSLGGHSLLVTQMISRVRETFKVELPVRDLFAAPTVAGFAFRVRQAMQSAERALLPPIAPIPRDGDLLLSFAQTRLWFFDQFEPGSSAYNLPVALRVRGPLDTAVMEAALSETVRRHEALRTTFTGIDGRPLQVIAAPAPVRLPQVDLRSLPTAERLPGALRWIQEEGRRPFDLMRGPLLRSLLVRVEDEESLLLLNMHHIVSDGWSMGVLVREICALYPALRDGQPSPLPELPIQHVDFASWQRQWLQGAVLEAELGYWREHLNGVPAALALPTDRQRPAMQTFAGASLAFALPRELSTRLQALSRRAGATLFMTLLAVFQELLGRYSGQSDLTVGTPIAGRTHLQTEELIGFFVNMLVVRTDLSGEPSFSVLVGRIRETLLSSYAHQDLPFETLVEELQPQRSLNRTPLYQVVFALQNTPSQVLTLKELSFEPMTVDTGMAKFELTVALEQTEDNLAGMVEYNQDLFDGSTVQRLVRHWEILLAGAIAAPELRLVELSLLSPEERAQLLVEWSGEDTGRRVYVLDRNLAPVPIGVPGDLYTAGGAPEGEYPPEQAAERFLPDPFGSGAGGRLFRTGDRVRWRSNGELAPLDRIDEDERTRARDETAPAQETSHTPVEELLAGIWAEVLEVETVSVRDNFFSLGGHSLLVTQMISRVRDTFRIELPARELFAAPTVAGFAFRIRQAMQSAARALLPPIVPVPRDHDLPLSFAQQRLWLVDQIEPGSPAYNIPMALRLGGPVTPGLLERIFSEIVRRHEALRTTFEPGEDGPAQVIHPPDRIELPLLDLSLVPEGERETRAWDLSLREARRPFDLRRGPLLRLLLMRLAEEDHLLLLTVHHIVSDGWSMDVLLREVAALHEAFSQGRPSPLAELPVQYADYAVWQRSWLQGDVLNAQLDHWKRRLDGAPALLELPLDRPRPAEQSYRGARHPVNLSPPLSAAIGRLCRQQGVTPFMALLAAWAVLLGRHAGQDDILVGAPVAGRNRSEIEGLIGFFLNTLVLRTDLSGNPSLADLMSQLRRTALDAFANQDLPFERLLEDLALERSLARAPLFQVMLVLQNTPGRDLVLPGLALSPVEVDPGLTKFDLSLTLFEGSQGLAGALTYAVDLFDPSTAGRLIDGFQTLLAGMAAADPDAPLHALEVLSTAERQQLLVDWSAGATGSSDLSLYGLFERQAERTPDAVAVIFEDERWTYRDLLRRSRQVAGFLRGHGAGPGDRVAILDERSAERVARVLGVLAAGAAYVALDRAQPPARRAELLADVAPVRLLPPQPPLPLTDEEMGAGVTLLPEMEPGSPEASFRTPEDLGPAYVVYTSGSTGRPKGILAHHRGAATYLEWIVRNYGFAKSDVALQLAPLTFDASLRDTLAPLAAGARIVIVPDDVARDPVGLLERMRAHGVTCLPSIVPSLLRLLVEEALASGRSVPSVPTLRLMLASGEKLHGADAAAVRRAFGERVRLVNQYGASETTMTSSWYPVAADDESLPALPVGRPAASMRMFLLDSRLRPVPLGAVGEICFGGPGVTFGYLNQPDRTAEVFIPDPFGAPGERLYRTGDRGRYRADGVLELHGRIDFQLKIRGQRVEPGEVEAALRSHPAVRQAVVAALGEPEPRLTAWLVAEGVETGDLRAFLAGRLPAPMVPTDWVFLDALPLTPHGKVDRSRLPEPSRERAAVQQPRDATELRLVRLWEEILGLQAIGIDDDFFSLGGHSLSAVRLVAGIRRHFGRDLPLSELFRRPTVERLAETLRSGLNLPWSPLVAITPGMGTPLFCIHGGDGHALTLADLAKALSAAGEEGPVFALEARGLADGQVPLERIDDLADLYLPAIREAWPHGPYRLLGYSMGGKVAFEIARRLELAGETVEPVVLLDIPAFPSADASTDLEIPAEIRALPGFDAELADRYLAVWKAHLRASHSWTPAPYGGKVRLIVAEDGTRARATDPTLGWETMATGGVEVVLTPGDHFSMVQPPHVQTLAARVRNGAAEAHLGRSSEDGSAFVAL